MQSLKLSKEEALFLFRSDLQLTQSTATEVCRVIFDDYWFHLQMMFLDGRISDDDYNALDDRY